MNSTTVPILRYRDADRAIDWLCRAFGFEVFLKVASEEGGIEHARLILDNNMVMLASNGRPGSFEEQFKLPSDVGGVTQSIVLRVANPDSLREKAGIARAVILTDVTDAPSGGRMFSCLDCESHVWVFSSSDLWAKTW